MSEANPEQLPTPPAGERRAALATLVATRGTSPKKEGAKMWVGENGRILGAVTIGGCVDARVVEASEGALRSGESRVLSVDLGAEQAWDLGLTCSGTVDVLIEPVDLDRGDPVLRAHLVAAAEVREGRAVAVVAPLAGERHRLVVFGDGRLEGTLGAGALDARAAERALDLMARSESRVESLPREGGGEALDVFVEVHAPPASLLVVGAGAVAGPLVAIGRELGMRTVLVDARPRFATRERFPGAHEVRVGTPSEIVASMPLHASTALVLVAHDYKFDLPVLRVALDSAVGYIGLLGSRRRGRAILDFLADEGRDGAALARVHVPVGLDIGARSAPEIALSVLAEVIAEREGRPGTPLRDGAGA